MKIAGGGSFSEFESTPASVANNRSALTSGSGRPITNNSCDLFDNRVVAVNGGRGPSSMRKRYEAGTKVPFALAARSAHDAGRGHEAQRNGRHASWQHITRTRRPFSDAGGHPDAASGAHAPRDRAAPDRQHGTVHMRVRRQEVFRGVTADRPQAWRAGALRANQRPDDGAPNAFAWAVEWMSFPLFRGRSPARHNSEPDRALRRYIPYLAHI